MTDKEKLAIAVKALTFYSYDASGRDNPYHDQAKEALEKILGE